MIHVFADADALAHGAAEAFVLSCREAITARGRFVVALSGGSTPKRLHRLLAQHPYRDYVEWTRVFVLFGDERFVPPTDEQSNEHMARETLLSQVPVPEEQIFGMYSPVEADGAATRYEKVVLDLLGKKPEIDLTLLGIGPDGHTASLFPGRPSVFEKDRLVIAAEANAGVGMRITMTVPLLTASQEIHFLVAGPDKAEPLKRVLEAPEDWSTTPAQAVVRHAPNVRVFADTSAAALLSTKGD